MQVTYRRRLRHIQRSNGDEYFLIAIPPVVAKSMDCNVVDLIVGEDSIKMQPVQRSVDGSI